MQIISFTEARNSLKSVLDRVVNDADCTVITRRDSEDAVVMSLDYYDSLMEMVYLLKSPANAEHLRKSIDQFNQGKAMSVRHCFHSYILSRIILLSHSSYDNGLYTIKNQ